MVIVEVAVCNTVVREVLVEGRFDQTWNCQESLQNDLLQNKAVPTEEWTVTKSIR